MAFLWDNVILGSNNPLSIAETSSMAEPCGGFKELLIDTWEKIVLTNKLKHNIDKTFIV